MKEAYAKFRRGDPITDEEIADILTAIALAEPFMDASPDFALFRKQAIYDRDALEGYQKNRRWGG